MWFDKLDCVVPVAAISSETVEARRIKLWSRARRVGSPNRRATFAADEISFIIDS
jgi:hypothetical protein